MKTSQYRAIRLLYLTYNENVLESGILRSQVQEMLIEMTKRAEIAKIRLLSFISPRLWIRRRSGYNQLVRDLKRQGIDFRVRLMPAAQAWKWFGIPLFLFFCLPVLISHILMGGFDILHARGYGAGLLSHLSAKITRIRFVFDPRGWFADEMVLNGVWKKNSFTYRLWKVIEAKLIRYSDCVVALTPRFKRDFIDMGSKKAIFAPSRLKVKRFSSASKNATEIRKDLLFIGQMDADWNSPVRVAAHFKRIKSVVPGLKLHLITFKDEAYVGKVLDENGVNRDDWSLESSLPDEMPRRMAGSGAGLTMAYRPSGNWPMKFGEYLAAGVPVVVEKQIGEHITAPVRRYRLGAVIDENDLESYNEVAELFRCRSEYSERCIRYARLKLEISHTAAQYARLYKEILNR